MTCSDRSLAAWNCTGVRIWEEVIMKKISARESIADGRDGPPVGDVSKEQKKASWVDILN
jgi:hypothetical protein